jgi:phosphatidylserine decarboxylase
MAVLGGAAAWFLARDVDINALATAACAFAITAIGSIALLFYRFYRDPDRSPPNDDDVVVSPADGKVVYVRESRAGMLPVTTKRGDLHTLHELTGTDLASADAVVIGISMNFLDVHVNRAPIAGEITSVREVPGRFGSLRHPEMVFMNQRATTVIQTAAMQVAIVQIASRLVRRICTWVRVGEAVSIGQRIGAIRFGSQVDVLVPARSTVQILVAPGDLVRAGETVVARVTTSDNRSPG